MAADGLFPSAFARLHPRFQTPVLALALQAAWAVKLISPKVAIPMHYKTFPIIAQDAKEFTALVHKEAPGVKVVALGLGEEYIHVK